ncbi:MAG: reverse transcriptase family protein, partial [Chthoniobacterales bacterium]
MTSWAPHSFTKLGRRQGVPETYLEPLLIEGRRLTAKGLPVVFTLAHLAALCDVPYQFLRQVASRRADAYRVFNLRKRSGGYRQITVPEPILMLVQRWIHHLILKQAEVSAISTAYSVGAGPVSNARRHCDSRWLVKLDIKSFFESISERQVYKVFRSLGYPSLLAF